MACCPARLRPFSHYEPESEWPSSGIPGFEKRNKESVCRITELLASSELRDEGRVMQHCVATYAGRCKDGRVAIFSLTITTKLGTTREVTIEVDPRQKRIIQARKKCNMDPTDNDIRLLTQWAQAAGLRRAG